MRVGAGIALALLVLTLLVYAPVGGNEFVNYDDDVYVTANPHVAHGLDGSGFLWSWTAFVHGNWHPVTLLSHMLDVSLFGLDSGAHHRVNLALHALNVLLLFSLLALATAQLWPSALVAALFAVHPQNVETVAWIAERKSLLCTTFWLLALLAFVRYRRRGGAAAYAAVVVLAALALASKPMAVTLPLTIFLFDRWPLESRTSLARSARELALPVALAFACGLLTLAAQRAVQALQSVEAYPLWVRIENAIVAYAWYLVRAVWPDGLAVFYPHPGATVSAGAVAASAVLLLVVLATVLGVGKRFPPPATGWWWYAGTLLPVAGIVQVGSQAYADRYAYVPLIGIFVAVAFALAKAVEGRARAGRFVSAVAVLVVLAFAVRARAQTHVWHDSVSLFRHAVEVVPDGAVAHNNLGMALAERGRMEEAIPHFRSAITFAPWDADARSNLGNALRAVGKPREAIEEYRRALDQRPDDPTIHYNLATALIDVGRLDEARARLEEALRLDPEYRKARNLLGTLDRRR